MGNVNLTLIFEDCTKQDIDDLILGLRSFLEANIPEGKTYSLIGTYKEVLR
jgi:hypothetical protein